MKIISTNNHYTNFGGKTSKITKNALEKCVLEKMSIQEIANHFGVKENTIYAHIQKNNFQTPLRLARSEREEQYKVMQNARKLSRQEKIKENAQQICLYATEQIKKGVKLIDIAKQKGISLNHLIRLLSISNINFIGIKKELKRQKIAELMKQGKTQAEIARTLQLSPTIVGVYVRDIKKLGF